MKMILRIARAELQTLFYSPIAWLILIIFTVQASMAYCNVLEWQVSSQALAYKLESVSMTIFAQHRMGVFTIVQQYLYLYIPLLTMGLMSRELSSGSIKLLYSSPVTNTQIILGKYMSMVFYALLISIILMIFMVFSLITIPQFDFWGVTSGLIGLFLLICAYAAVGLFMSSLTSYQVVAAIGTLATLTLLNLVGSMWQDVAFVRDIAYWLSMKGRSTEFINGLICSEDVLYFLIVIALFLSLSILRLKAIRQKTPFRIAAGRYVGVVLIAVILGYITSRPALMFYHDSTRTNLNTLTPNSQKIVAQMKGDLTVNTYVNILDAYYYLAMPKSELRDMETFRQYTRFKPEIKMNYIRYYDHANNPRLDKRYPGKSDKERMIEYAKVFKLDSAIFKTPEEIQKIENLKSEGNRFVRTLVRENGEKTFLRVFDDRSVQPSEAEITAAFKRMVMNLPEIGFVTGHGERSATRSTDGDYSVFAQEKTFRYSLINQGFDYSEVSLDKEIPKEISILVLADVKSSLTPEQQANLDNYVQRGGNLLIAGEPGRQSVVNPILERFGVKLMDGTLVRQSANFAPDFIQAIPTKEGSDMIYLIDDMKVDGYITTMPGCAGLTYSKDKGFNVTEMFVSDTTGGTWSETGAAALLDDSAAVIKPSADDSIMVSIPTVLALDRKVGDKIQKIIISGDADCISNGEISIGRKDVNAANYNFIMGAFYWMSDEEVPIDVRRPTPPDDKISMGVPGISVTRWALMGVLPLAMLIFYILIWVRRKSR
ncbi:MAG: Gldg family protein [Rikenellaceae bacterium]|nr:Gldg family protein [Rikenellaceae bacterium]